MRILLTGAAGFIGFHTTKRILERGDSVVGIDSINSYYDPELKFARLAELGIDREAEAWGKAVHSTAYPNMRFIRMKLENQAAIESLFKEYAFDRVIHLAAQAGVRYSIDHPREYIDSNIVGFLNILEACRHAKISHLVYASSSSVYGLNDTRPFSTQDHTDHPVSLYAATKKSNELMAHSYSHLYGLPTTGLRFFTVYGPWGRPDMAYFKFAKAIVEGRPIDIYNDGDMWRDFTYVDDIVEGILRIADKIPQGDKTWDPANPDPSRSRAPYRVFNIGNNHSERLSTFIEELEKAIGKVAIKKYLPMQPGDVYATEAEIDDLENTVRWKPHTSITEGLKRFVEWFAAHYKPL
ncbi:MAG: NAD-dependent epimerase [Rectinemataceae bacterium]